MDLSSAQWCVLDLLMRARQKGVHRLNRLEIAANKAIPQGAALKLMWAALTMPNGLVVWTGQHDFSITPAGVELFNSKFKRPTEVGDQVICLPGPEHYLSS